MAQTAPVTDQPKGPVLRARPTRRLASRRQPTNLLRHPPPPRHLHRQPRPRHLRRLSWRPPTPPPPPAHAHPIRHAGRTAREAASLPSQAPPAISLRRCCIPVAGRTADWSPPPGPSGYPLPTAGLWRPTPGYPSGPPPGYPGGQPRIWLASGLLPATPGRGGPSAIVVLLIAVLLLAVLGVGGAYALKLGPFAPAPTGTPIAAPPTPTPTRSASDPPSPTTAVSLPPKATPTPSHPEPRARRNSDSCPNRISAVQHPADPLTGRGRSRAAHACTRGFPRLVHNQRGRRADSCRRHMFAGRRRDPRPVLQIREQRRHDHRLRGLPTAVGN